MALKLKKWIRSKRFWKRIIVVLLCVPIVLFFILAFAVYSKQDELVQNLVKDLNKDFVGATEISDSHISMFENFPYISIDVEAFKIHESKKDLSKPLVHIHHLYVGFNLWTILSGEMKIKKIKLKGGKINLVQHRDGSFNIVKALTSVSEIESTEEEFHLDLKKIELENIDLTKLNEENGIKVETYLNKVKAKFKTNDNHMKIACDAQFQLNILKDGDTTFLKHKQLNLKTKLDFLKGKDVLSIQPTSVHLEDSEFSIAGEIDFLNDVFLDLQFTVNNPNFDLFVAMAPEEIIPTLRQYKNKGEIYVDTKIKGKSINGFEPSIQAKFGCRKGEVINPKTKKKIQNVNFDGFFSNGSKQQLSTMQFSLHHINAKLEGGNIRGNIDISNFIAPRVILGLQTHFDMGFISKFLNLDHLQEVSGKAKASIRFDDCIDLGKLEQSMVQLNEKYEMKMELKNVHLRSSDFALPIKNFNFLAEIQGHKADIKKFELLLGRSDIEISGTIDDLPAILHHSDKVVETQLAIASRYIDLYELTGADSNAVDEQIKDLKLDFRFKASARSFTESKYLPRGEFFIENLYAKLKHYPHTFHDFHADVFIEEQDLRVVDFRGMIDQSDFRFTGKLAHYEKWFDEHPGGDSKIEFNLVSKKLQLKSFLRYKGENYVPEEYRHEELDDLMIHGFTYLHYDEELKSLDVTIDKFAAKMKIHPLRFENFKGRIHYEDEHLVVEDFQGKLDKSQFKTTLHYYLGTKEAIKKRDNHFSITASHLDLDQLFKYNPAPIIAEKGEAVNSVDHDAGFNIYELPFTNMTYHIDIAHLNYHRYLLKNIKGNLRTTPKHYLYIDHLNLDAAGGHFEIDGYFNGSNPDVIYISPTIKVKNVDLDKLMFKFENFGQDHIVSENLHGKFSGTIRGKIHVHRDLVPKIDDSEIHLDLDVTHGQLENYSVLAYMSDYFSNKNLNSIRFDTLFNHVDLVNGVMTIPKMTVNSTLGHMEISGKQDVSGNMEYYLRVPWGMVKSAAASKLFGDKKREVPDDQEDVIQRGDQKTRYVNVKIVGDEKGYKFSMGKAK
jgi:hypothetical protein